MVFDRFLDWMLVCTIWEWFDWSGGELSAWWAAQRDLVVGDALWLLYGDLAVLWTVVDLVDCIGVFRSTLVKCFL